MIKLEAGEYLGSYRVQKFLGRGGFAYVYQAEDHQGRKVALKIGDVAGGGRYVTRFVEITDERSQEWISPDETPGEAVFFRQRRRPHRLPRLARDRRSRASGSSRSLDGARSQNLVKVRDVFEIEGRPVIVMDFVRGKTLREKIRALEGIRLNWFLAIVRSLQKLKAAGQMAYHGDLKPENILVKPSGTVVMIDPAHRQDGQNLISTTPHYNPLLLRSSKADVMGIGVMLYEILTGTLPFEDVPWQYAGREQGGEVERLSLSYFLSYPPPRDMNPNTPEPLERITYRCLTVMDYDLPDLEADLVEFLRKD